MPGTASLAAPTTPSAAWREMAVPVGAEAEAAIPVGNEEGEAAGPVSNDDDGMPSVQFRMPGAK